MALFKSKHSEKTLEIEDNYDVDTGVNKAFNLNEMDEKGWIPARELVSPKSGKRLVVENSQFDGAVEKGWRPLEVVNGEADAQKRYIADKKAELDSPRGREETMARNFAQNWTMGGADEIGAAIIAPFSSKTREQLQEENQLNDALANEVNPKVALGSQLIASTPMLLASGGAVAAANTGKIARAVTLGKEAAKNAVIGGVSGFNSDNGDVNDRLSAAAQSAGIAAAIPVGMAAVKPIARTLIAGTKGVGKMLTAGSTGLARSEVDHYITNPNAIKNAKNLTEVAEDSIESAKAIKNETSRLSGESFKVLDKEGVQIPIEDVKKLLDVRIEKRLAQGSYTDDAKADLKKLQELRGMLNEEPEFLVGGQGKTLLQQYRDKAFAKTEQGVAVITPEMQKDLRQVQNGVDKMLKDSSPNYKKIMDETRPAELLRGEIEKPLKNNRTALRSLRVVANEKDPFLERSLSKIDEQFGTSVLPDLKNATIKDKLSANAEKMLARKGSGDSEIGKAISSAVSYARQYALRPAGVAAMDSVAWAKANVAPWAAKLGPAGKVLMDAAQNGPTAFLIHYNAFAENPKFKALLEQANATQD